MERTASPDAIGPGEAARRLGVSTRTVQRWLREGRLPAVRVGGRLKVDAIALRGAELARGPSAASKPIPAGSRGIRRLLVANRGELVVRIARTCRAQGIACVALVSADQVDAWWAARADERVALDGSYLDIGAVLDAARRTGADAIHPGYGFLAENAEFAAAVAEAGIAWVGPPAEAMRRLGDKASARRLAASVGVPVLAGYDGDDQSVATLAAAAATIGFPVLIKPSAGGGGKGMHVVRGAPTLAEAIGRARRESSAAFGDARLILERYVEAPRHVEVQFLVDRHGAAVHLGERDCSLQRRHQKVIEEAPAPGVDGELRARLGDAALRLAVAAGYVGAGTAEFLLDDAGGWFFLEVNARLQVEHPVTEAVTGRDLVADQLRIAAGEPLGIAQQDVRWSGHAIEARLYAEDPWSGFLPTGGKIADVRWPAGPGVRVDAGIGPGDAVGTRYDPLLAKVIAAAPSRDEAIARLDAALGSTAIVGLTTNRGFLRDVLAMPEVLAGRIDTGLIERRPPPDAHVPVRAVEAAARMLVSGAGSVGASTVGPGFRLNARPRVGVVIEGPDGTEERWVGLALGGESVGDVAMALDPDVANGPAVVLDADGRALRVRLAPAPSVETAASHAHRPEGAEQVSAPMPGNVLEVRVAPGDVVEAGAILLLLEAMKMEIAIPAPIAATVTAVHVAPGTQVQRGDVLVALE